VRLMLYYYISTDTADIYLLSLHDALPIYGPGAVHDAVPPADRVAGRLHVPDAGRPVLRLAGPGEDRLRRLPVLLVEVQAGGVVVVDARGDAQDARRGQLDLGEGEDVVRRPPPQVVGPHVDVDVQGAAPDHQLEQGRAGEVGTALGVVQVPRLVPYLDHGPAAVGVQDEALQGRADLATDAGAVGAVLPELGDAGVPLRGPAVVGEPAHDLERVRRGEGHVELPADAGRQRVGRVHDPEGRAEQLPGAEAAGGGLLPTGQHGVDEGGVGLPEVAVGLGSHLDPARLRSRSPARRATSLTTSSGSSWERL